MLSPECFAERMRSSCPGGARCQPPARAQGPYQLCRHVWASLASGDGCSPDCCRHQIQVNILTEGKLPFLQRERFCHEAVTSLSYSTESLSDPTKERLLAIKTQAPFVTEGKFCYEAAVPFLTIQTPCQFPSQETIKPTFVGWCTMIDEDEECVIAQTIYGLSFVSLLCVG